ncbi:hypothetical protein, partial [Schleiferia thermophila]
PPHPSREGRRCTRLRPIRICKPSSIHDRKRKFRRAISGKKTTLQPLQKIHIPARFKYPEIDPPQNAHPKPLTESLLTHPTQ